MSRFSERHREIDWGAHKDWKPARKTQETGGQSAPYFLPDIKPFQSPIDYSEITSRSQLAEHERRYGVRQCGELKHPQDFDNTAKRSEAFNERRFEEAFRTAIERTGL